MTGRNATETLTRVTSSLIAQAFMAIDLKVFISRPWVQHMVPGQNFLNRSGS